MSLQMHAVAAYARLSRRRRFLSPEAVAAYLAAPKGRCEPPSRMRRLRRHPITRRQFGDFRCYTVHPVGGVSDGSQGSVVYVHGGAYVSEIQPQHWTLIAEIAEVSGRPVHVPIYGLAPAHDARQAHDFLRALLTDLTRRGPVYVAGDSSGGGLALAATQAWIGQGGDRPLGLTLIAPWLDITLGNNDIQRIAPRDPWLAPSGLRDIGRAWAHGLDGCDPRVSPLNGDLTDLPFVDYYIGTRDILLPDSRLLRDRIGHGGIRFHQQHGGLHVYPLLPTPEGRRARRTLTTHVAHAFAGDG